MTIKYIAFQLIMELDKRPSLNFTVDYRKNSVGVWTHGATTLQQYGIYEHHTNDIRAKVLAEIIEAMDNDS